MITQQVKLNLIPGQVFPRVNASQYDNGTRTLQMILYNGDQVFNIASGMTAVVQGTKPDKTGFQYAATITEGSNIATLDITQQMTAVKGDVTCELVISNGNNRIATVNFILYVEAAALAGDTVISETDLPLIEEAAELAQRIDGIAQQVADDADRAETAADNAELWASRNPYIGSNGNWFVFDSTTEQYVDSQIAATGPQGPQGVQGEIGPQGPTGPTGNGIVGITKTGTSGLVDTYTITFTDGSTTTFTVTNGQDGQGAGDMTKSVYDSTNAVADAGGIVAYVAAHSGAGTLAGLTDVALSNLQDGQTIVYNATLGKWINGEAPSEGLLPHFYIDSESGSTVTVTTPSGDTITPTQISSGHWECDVPEYGVYTVHAVLNGEDATVSVTVDTVKEYHITDTHYSYTLSVYAPTGSTIRVNANSETYTGTGAGSTATVFALHQASTTYTITNTMDGVAKTDSLTTPATSGESGSKTISWATIDLTYSEDYIGQTINAVSGSTTITKTGSSALSATFYIPTLGEWTISSTVSGQTYSTSVTVSEFISYNAELSAGFTWQEWVDTASRLSSSDYTSLSDVLEDQEALRELFLEHACVDYMAEATSANADIETIINTDLAAKWINNSDYALDTLYANTIIKGYMDTADKYFYGEWALVGQVPKMTSNTAPYGTASAKTQYSNDYAAWKAFDGSTSSAWNSAYNATSAAGEYIRFVFPTAVVINRLMENCSATLATSFISCLCYLEGSNTGNDGDWTKVGEFTPSDNGTHYYDFDNSTAYTQYQIRGIDKGNVFSQNSWSLSFTELQFYSWQPKGNVPVMTSNTAPYGSVNAGQSMYSGEEAYKAFDGNPSTWASAASNTTDGYVGYSFTNPINVRRVYIGLLTYGTYQYKVQYSDDGSTWTYATDEYTTPTAANPYIDIDDCGYHLHWRIHRHSASAAGGIVQELQFYGRELSVSVPAMTSDTTPYGEASDNDHYDNTYKGYLAFTNQTTAPSSTNHGWASSKTDAAGSYFQYKFPSKVKMTKAYIYDGMSSNSKSVKIQGSNNGSDWEDGASVSLTSSPYQHFVDLSFDEEYEYYRFYVVSGNFAQGGYGIKLQLFGEDYSEKEFEEGATKKWLYDHGVKTSGLTSHVTTNGTVTDDGETLLLKINGGSNYHAIAYSTEDLSDYSLFRVKVGKQCYSSQSASFINIGVFKEPLPSVGLTGSNLDANVAFGGSYNLGAIPNNLSLDITAFNESRMIGVFCSTAGTLNMWADVKEMWLE